MTSALGMEFSFACFQLGVIPCSVSITSTHMLEPFDLDGKQAENGEMVCATFNINSILNSSAVFPGSGKTYSVVILENEKSLCVHAQREQFGGHPGLCSLS